MSTVMLQSSDGKTNYGTLQVNSNFPGSPAIIVWNNRVFVAAPGFGETTITYAESDDALFVAANAVITATP